MNGTPIRADLRTGSKSPGIGSHPLWRVEVIPQGNTVFYRFGAGRICRCYRIERDKHHLQDADLRFLDLSVLVDGADNSVSVRTSRLQLEPFTRQPPFAIPRSTDWAPGKIPYCDCRENGTISKDAAAFSQGSAYD